MIPFVDWLAGQARRRDAIPGALIALDAAWDEWDALRREERAG